jgi:hypothetical protein
LGPDGFARKLSVLEQTDEKRPAEPFLPHLIMPAHHDVRVSSVHVRRLRGNLAAAADCGEGFCRLILIPGVGARTVRALAIIAEVSRGAKAEARAAVAGDCSQH